MYFGLIIKPELFGHINAAFFGKERNGFHSYTWWWEHDAMWLFCCFARVNGFVINNYVEILQNNAKKSVSL